jgi:serralysin
MAVFQGTDNNDVLVGDAGGRVQPVALDKMKISQDVTAHVHFDSSHAGFHNSVGMYVYDDSGKVVSTKIMFGDVSGMGVKGATDFDMTLKAGQHIGFFVAPNAAGHSDIAGMLAEGGSFHLASAATGQAANVFSGEPMQIAYQSPTGQWSTVHTEYWTDIFATNTNDNRDGFQHAKVSTDPVTGQMHVAFEDLSGGGDQNFGDAVFTVDIGSTNAALMAHDSKGGHGDHNYNDSIWGNDGDDTLIGLSGNDGFKGGAGNDTIFGGSGDDYIFGGTGNNVLNGGQGNDAFIAEGGNDVITGGAGFDAISFAGATSGVNVNLNTHIATGYGTDKISGVEAVVGSAFDDVITGDKQDNLIQGNKGNDVIRGGKGADTLFGNEGNDTFVWHKSDVGTGVDVIVDFMPLDWGLGHDVLNLHDVLKGSTGSLADKVKLVEDGYSSHLWAKVEGNFVEVAILGGVNHTSVADLYKAGALLI